MCNLKSVQETTSPEERAAVTRFKENHLRNKNGRFVVPLSRKPNPPSLSESRSQTVRRFLSLERSLHSKKIDVQCCNASILSVMPSLFWPLIWKNPREMYSISLCTLLRRNPVPGLRFELYSTLPQNHHLESPSTISYWLSPWYILPWLMFYFVSNYIVSHSPLM